MSSFVICVVSTYLLGNSETRILFNGGKLGTNALMSASNNVFGNSSSLGEWLLGVKWRSLC